MQNLNVVIIINISKNKKQKYIKQFIKGQSKLKVKQKQQNMQKTWMTYTKIGTWSKGSNKKKYSENRPKTHIASV